MGLRSKVKQAGFCNGARSAVFLWYIPLYPTHHCCLFCPDCPMRLSNAIEIKGSLGVIGFCVGFFPYTLLRLLCNGNQRVVWFHQVSCQIFPPTTVHNMRLLCKLKSKGHFIGPLCCWFFSFLSSMHTTIKTFYAIQIERGFPRVLCCFCAQCPKNTMAKNKLW